MTRADWSDMWAVWVRSPIDFWIGVVVVLVHYGLACDD